MSGKPGVKKGSLHPRNRHQGRYDFEKLKQAHPDLIPFVAKNKYGEDSIDFANPEAVKCLNRALLKDFYQIEFWDIPKDYLCPPIPGRADYIHNLADLLGEGGAFPRGPQVRVLDIGVGANCIYPLIGQHDYDWSFVGADLNPAALENAASIIEKNALGERITLRLQKSAKHIFTGIIQAGESFSATSCNPPFHASLKEAQMGTARKWKQLGKAHEKQKVNFGGQGAELWCEGGELAFLERMIAESILFQDQVKWFTTLVSRGETLSQLERLISKSGARRLQTLDMEQGQKKSRILAWSFNT